MHVSVVFTFMCVCISATVYKCVYACVRVWCVHVWCVASFPGLPQMRLVCVLKHDV